MLSPRTFLPLVALAAIGLSGCVTGNTYGTGTTQEMQLVRDVSSLVTLKRAKPPKIDYAERPGLVRPANGASLPAPVEKKAAASSGSVSAFPVSPEERRARRRAVLKKGGRLPKRSNSVGPTVVGEELSEEDEKFMNWRGAPTAAYRRWLDKRSRARKTTAKVTRRGDAPRRYLTQPPVEYRKAYESAPQGELGQTESSKAFKKKSKGNIFSRLLGRG